MLLVRTITHSLFGLAVVFILSAIVEHNHAPGLTLVLHLIGPEYGLPFAVAWAIGANHYQKLTIPAVVAILIVFSVSSLEQAAMLLTPMGIGIVIGNACRGIMTPPRGTDARPQQSE